MYLNKIDFPNRIIDALRAEKLVIFAGAGASMDRPTSLPNFENLTKEIAKDTGKTKKKEESCENFLGDLKAEGIDVNAIAAAVLSDSCLVHNVLHEAIVDLFITPEKAKIVTTNYDQMFEQVLKERNINVPIFTSPALPLGNDVSGIVHIHGNVSDSNYMVLTDEDFGKAYLTEGYTSRFLVKLFESYTVLFVGYSYNDTIMRYLTRAMSRQYSSNRFILTDEEKPDWKALGITPIYYPKRSHALMRDGLIKLGRYTKKGLWEWRNQFADISDEPPKDLTIETEIDYCLENIERSNVLSSCIHGSAWLDVLDKKGVFNSCFSDAQLLNDNDKIWGVWLCNQFVGKDDNSLKTLFTKHGCIFNHAFAELLFRQIIRDDNIVSEESFKEYCILFDNYFSKPWLIAKCIEVAIKKQLPNLALRLFEKLFGYSMRLERIVWAKEERFEPKPSMIGDYYFCNHAWEMISSDVVHVYPLEVLEFVVKTIEDLHYKYEDMGVASDKKEPWSMAMLVVEDRVKDYSKEAFHVLVKAYLEAVRELNDPKYVSRFLLRCLDSKSILLRKISLRAIRETQYFSNDEIIGILCDKNRLWGIEEREQVFLLAKEVFNNASKEKQNQFLDLIEKGPIEYFDEQHKEYSIYNWSIWLRTVDPVNKRIQKIIDNILSKNDFSPRSHPELIITEVEAEWRQESRPDLSQKMLTIPSKELVSWLSNDQGRSIDSPSRQELLHAFYDSVKSNIQWGRETAEYFYTQKIEDEEAWNWLIKGFEEADITMEEQLSLCQEFLRIGKVVPDVTSLARFLLRVIQSDKMEPLFKYNELLLYDLSLIIWNKRPNMPGSLQRLIDKAFNTTTGIIMLCWIHMLSLSKDTGIPEQYKTRYEEALKLDGWEQEVAICVLAGHFNYLCIRDRDWCTNYLAPLLTSDNEKKYKSAWEGIVWFSRRISRDTADIMAPIYLKATKQIKWLKREARDGFIELYLTLLIYVVEKPTLKYIPEFYRSSDEKMHKDFVHKIGHQLRHMDPDSKNKWWNKWLKRFFENRKQNKPTQLTELECQELFMLLPRLGFVLEEAVAILCKGDMPKDLDSFFWFDLNEEKIASKYPNSIAKLMIKLLGSNIKTDFGESSIANIIRDLHDLDEKDKHLLQEVLLKHNISIELD